MDRNVASNERVVSNSLRFLSSVLEKIEIINNWIFLMILSSIVIVK